MIDITGIGPRYLQVYSNYDQFSAASDDYVKGEDHICYVVTENEIIYWIALENVWRPLNVVTTSAGTIEGIDNPVNVTLRTVDGGVLYTRVPNIPDAERIINMDNFLQNYPQIEYLDFTGNVNTTSMVNAFANSNIKSVGNIDFDKVENITSIFENCTNFDEGYSITIDSDVTQFDCENCVLGSNLPELTINITNVNNGNLDLRFFNKSLNTDLIINYNDTFTYDLSTVAHNYTSDQMFGFSTQQGTKCENSVKCPLFITGYYGQVSDSYTYVFNMPKNLECELFISRIDNYYLSNQVYYPNWSGEQLNVSTKQVLFDYQNNSCAPHLTSYYDILFDNDVLQGIRILNQTSSWNQIYNISGTRIDLNKIQLIKGTESSAVLNQGFVYSGDNPVTIDTLNTFPTYTSYGFPYFKDLELSELQDSNIDNTTEGKSVYCAFTQYILPYGNEIEDKTKLGTHVFKNIDYVILELNNIPNLTLESSSEKNTTLIEYDAINRYYVVPTNTLNLTGNFEIDRSKSISGVKLFLGSGINFNNVIFDLTSTTQELSICCVGENELRENNTVFDSDYNYQFLYSGAAPKFKLQSEVYGPQVSIDKIANDNMIYSNYLYMPSASCNNRFLYAKYNENLQITINNATGVSGFWASGYLDFYYKYFNNENKPIIVDTEVAFNSKSAMYCEGADAKEALIDMYSGDLTNDDFHTQTFDNQEQYDTYLQETTTMYINCTDNGSIGINVYGYAQKNIYYDYYVGYCRRINNLEYIYGTVTLSSKINSGSKDDYNSTNSSYLFTLNRDYADGIISHIQGNQTNSKSKLKHMDVTKALKGYWDIRFMPDLDQETVKAIVNNLEAWDGDYQQDFNLYRNQWNYLSTEEQELLTTKNYNVRITENTPPNQLMFYDWNNNLVEEYVFNPLIGLYGGESLWGNVYSIYNFEDCPVEVQLKTTSGEVFSNTMITYTITVKNIDIEKPNKYNYRFTIKWEQHVVETFNLILEVKQTNGELSANIPIKIN